MFPKMRFSGSTRKTLSEGNNLCAIRVFGAGLNHSGSWSCMVDYTGWRDYGISEEWCTAAASAWLEVSI